MMSHGLPDEPQSPRAGAELSGVCSGRERGSRADPSGRDPRIVAIPRCAGRHSLPDQRRWFRVGRGRVRIHQTKDQLWPS